MAPPKGFPKPDGSGRTKGSRNRRNVEVERPLSSLDCDPREGLVQIARAATATGDYHLAAYCVGALMPYKYPALSRLTVTPRAGDEAAALMAAIAAARTRGNGCDLAQSRTTWR